MLEKLPEGVGRALQSQRAGWDHLLIARCRALQTLLPLTLASPDFENQGTLPVAYTADGEGLSPPLLWAGDGGEATCMALIVEDADSPTPHPLVHAIAVLDPHAGRLGVGDLCASRSSDGRLSLGLNSYLKRGWIPPDPPPGHGPHRYVFQLFALRRATDLSDSPGRSELEHAISLCAFAAGHLVGVYERPTRVAAVKADAPVPALEPNAAPVG